MKSKSLSCTFLKFEKMEPRRGFEPRRLMPVVFETTTVPLGYLGFQLVFYYVVEIKHLLKNNVGVKKSSFNK